MFIAFNIIVLSLLFAVLFARRATRLTDREGLSKNRLRIAIIGVLISFIIPYFKIDAPALLYAVSFGIIFISAFVIAKFSIKNLIHFFLVSAVAILVTLLTIIEKQFVVNKMLIAVFLTVFCYATQNISIRSIAVLMLSVITACFVFLALSRYISIYSVTIMKYFLEIAVFSVCIYAVLYVFTPLAFGKGHARKISISNFER